MKKQLIFLDNGVKRRYACVQTFDNADEVRKKWDLLIATIEQLIPSFEGDYESIDIPISRLEYINQGDLTKRLLKEKKKEFCDFFPAPKSLLSILSSNNQEDLINQIDKVIEKAALDLKEFFIESLDCDCLIKWCRKGRETFPCHENASCIVNELKNWEEALSEGKQAYAFQELIRDLAWDSLFRHEWLIPKSPDEWERNQSSLQLTIQELCEKEKNIAIRLFKSYLNQKIDGCNLSSAALLSRLMRIGAFDKHPDTVRGLTSQPLLYERNGEMSDVNFIDYLCTGYVFKDEKRPVIVVSNDFKNQEQRLQYFIHGLREINKFLHKDQSITFCPGILVLINQDDPSYYKKVMVENLMK